MIYGALPINHGCHGCPAPEPRTSKAPQMAPQRPVQSSLRSQRPLGIWRVEEWGPIQQQEVDIVMVIYDISGWWCFGTMDFFLTFPSFWEYIIIPTEEVHHFSEGLAASTNQY